MNMHDHQLCIGAHASHGDPVMLDSEERRRHLYVIGQTGTGKSTLFLNLIQQDLVAGEGLALLDPHGDLAEAVLAHIPKSRANDLVYINPADIDRPIGFNPLSCVPHDLKPIVADGVVSAFRHVWPESWGPRLDYILTNAVRALSRADISAADRRVFHLYADEFQSFATESFTVILSEARKYALTLTVGHQYLAQVNDQLRSAVFGNVGSIIACRPGAEDAEIVAEQIGLPNPDALLDLPNFTAWARLLHRGVPTSPIRLDLYDAPHARRQSAHRLVNTSRMRFGRPRGEVEDRIRKFLAA
jgi:hypothetical protein